jgi:hypothetical protein
MTAAGQADAQIFRQRCRNECAEVETLDLPVP